MKVGTNAADQQRAGGAAGTAGQAAPGANGVAAAAPAGGKVASVDGSELDKASKVLGQASQALMTAAKAMASGRTPGSDLGGAYGPYRA